MKKLFKFTLCAFATLALANCTNDVTDDGGNAPVEKFKMTISAGVGDEDSRTAITYDNNKYHLKWNEKGESIGIVEVVDNYCGEITRATQKGGDEKVALFETEFSSVIVGGSTYDYLACYPYSTDVKFDVQNKQVTMNLPAEQTLTSEGSVDPNSTLLFASYFGEREAGRPYQIGLDFDNVAAYAKVTFKGLKLNANEVIKDIEFAINDENVCIAGPCTYDYNEEGKATTTACEDGSNKITLHVLDLNLAAGDEASGYAVKDFTVYFSALPANVTNFTVTVINADGRRYMKTVDATKTTKGYLPFEKGVIRTITINGDGFEVEKQKIYKKVKPGEVESGKNYIIVSQSATSGDTNPYVLKNNSTDAKSLAAVNLTEAGFTNKDELTLLNANASDYTWTFTGSDGTFTIASTGNKNYLNAAKQSEGMEDFVPLALGATNQTWKVGTYPLGSDVYRLTIESTTYSGDYIATDRRQTGGLFYSVRYYGWTQIYLYEETTDTDDVGDSQETVYVYYKKATKLEADKQYVISSEYDGIAYTMGNTGGTYMGIAVPIAQLVSETTGFEKVNENVIKRVESDNYVYTTVANSSGAYAFKSAKESSYLRYSGGTFTLSTGTPTYFTVGNGTVNTAFTVASGNFYMQPQRRESYLAVEWGCIQGAHDVSFWEVTDAPEEGGGDEPGEEDDEDKVTYKLVTTKYLPAQNTSQSVADVPDNVWTPIIITTTVGDTTYILSNTKNAEGTLSMTAIPADAVSSDELTIAPSKYLWEVVNRNNGYSFRSKGNGFLNTGSGWIDDTYSTTFTAEKSGDEGYYTVKTGSDYLTLVNGSLALTGSASNLFRFYSTPEAVNEQEEKENSGPQFDVVNAFTTGKMYIISGMYLGAEYLISSKTSFSTTRYKKDDVLTADTYKEYAFKATATSDGYFSLESVNNPGAFNNLGGGTTGGTLGFGMSTYSKWLYSNNQLANYSNSSRTYYLNIGISAWSLSTATSSNKIMIYEVTE